MSTGVLRTWSCWLEEAEYQVWDGSGLILKPVAEDVARPLSLCSTVGRGLEPDCLGSDPTPQLFALIASS